MKNTKLFAALFLAATTSTPSIACDNRFTDDADDADDKEMIISVASNGTIVINGSGIKREDLTFKHLFPLLSAELQDMILLEYFPAKLREVLTIKKLNEDYNQIALPIFCSNLDTLDISNGSIYKNITACILKLCQNLTSITITDNPKVTVGTLAWLPKLKEITCTLDNEQSLIDSLNLTPLDPTIQSAQQVLQNTHNIIMNPNTNPDEIMQAMQLLSASYAPHLFNNGQPSPLSRIQIIPVSNVISWRSIMSALIVERR